MKTIKNILFYSLAVATVIGLNSCQLDESELSNIPNKETTFFLGMDPQSPFASEFEIIKEGYTRDDCVIISSEPWVVEGNTPEECSWCGLYENRSTMRLTEGKGNIAFTFLLEPNLSINDRQATFRFRLSSGLVYIYTVKQSTGGASIEVFPNKINLNANASSDNQVDIKANTEWEVWTDSPDWLTVSTSTSGLGNSTLKFNVDANTGDSRSGKIVVELPAYDIADTVFVTQSYPTELLEWRSNMLEPTLIDDPISFHNAIMWDTPVSNFVNQVITITKLGDSQPMHTITYPTASAITLLDITDLVGDITSSGNQPPEWILDERGNPYIGPIVVNISYFREDGQRIWATTGDIETHTQYAGGSGTAEDPYQIYNFGQLQRVNQSLSAQFIQMADIDMSKAVDVENVPDGFTPIGFIYTTPFKGVYDGNGKLLEKMRIEIAPPMYNRLSAVALFAYTEGSEIRNVILKNAKISNRGSDTSAPSTNQGNYTAGIVGFQKSAGRIINCGNIDGHVTNNRTSNHMAAGIVGAIANSSVISGCYNTSYIESNNGAGGITGSLSPLGGITATIERCYNTGYIYSLAGNVGGISAAINGASTIRECFNSGTIESRGIVGGIHGSGFNVQIENCYNTGDICIIRDDANPFAGINGHFGSSAAYYGKVTKCFSTGRFGMPSQTASEKARIGGIGGLRNAANMVNLEISYCKFLKIDNGLVKVLQAYAANSPYPYNPTTDIKWSDYASSPHTDAEMQQQATYSSWDFENIWQFTEGSPYPQLRNNPHRPKSEFVPQDTPNYYFE